MDDIVAMQGYIDRMLPERLRRLQRLTSIPVVFGGSTKPAGGARSLVIGQTAGTIGASLRGLAVQPGRGLGGAVLRHGAPRRVNDYASTATITHDYDRIVVLEERLTSVFAVPVEVHGAVRGVVYGAVRDPHPIGDRALRVATMIASHIQRDVEDLLRPAPLQSSPENASRAALDELASIIEVTSDRELRERLIRIYRDLGGGAIQKVKSPMLAPREVDTLRLAARGSSNLEIAGELGLKPETVKAYLRTAMRKLGAHNRTAAVYAARSLGVL